MYDSVTLLFPGQGAQHVGMGDKLREDESFKLFSIADNILGYKLSILCAHGPDSELQLTENAQPAILTHSIALFQKLLPILKSKNIGIDKVLGHSVGEYAALVAAGAINFEDAVKAVHLRGKYMQEAVPTGKGKMIAIMRSSEEMVREACKTVSTESSKVMPANFNEPNQIVISGDADACDKAVKWLEDSSDRLRSIELKVSAPFHSSLMVPAAEKLKKHLDSINFRSVDLPYIANVDALIYKAGTTATTVKDNLYKQVCGSVLWSQSIMKIPEDTLCIEVGPGKVLAGLVRKINPKIKVIPLDKEDGLRELEEVLK